MKILVDENLLYAKELFQLLGDVYTIKSRSISIPKDILLQADALMVRSTIQVNSNLLYGSNIKFVGSATAGTEHIDRDWLTKNDITFISAPGSNAVAVVEYVLSALLWLAKRDNFKLCDKIVGIIGDGNIGSQLNQRLKILGVETLLCDPFKTNNNKYIKYYPLETLVSRANILTFHTPLTIEGPYSTWHLVDDNLLTALPDRCIIINTCRGPVIDNTALLCALRKGKNISVILDVWENEPNILLPLLSYVDIGTAHIAGYTLEGKMRGTIHLFNKYSQFIGHTKQINPISLLPVPIITSINLHGCFNEELLHLLSCMMYDIRFDDIQLRRIINLNNFDQLRENYYTRREWSSLFVNSDDVHSTEILSALGFYTKLSINAKI